MAMQSVAQKTTVVIAGAFNPSIIIPPWIAKNVLDVPTGQNFPVQVLAPITGIAQLPRFTFAGLSFSPSFQNLTFYLEDLDDAGCHKVCDAAARILELLPHTPVTGLGFNFGFTENQPSVRLLQLMSVSPAVADAVGQGAETVGRSWANLLNWDKALITVLAEIRGEEASLDLNFHYAVQSASEAQEVLKKQAVYAIHRDAAQRVATTLSQEEQE